MNEFVTAPFQDNPSTCASHRSSVVFGAETAVPDSSLGEWKIEKNISSSANNQDNVSTSNNSGSSESMWVLQVQPDPRFDYEGINNSDACLKEMERIGIIRLAFENCYLIPGAHFSSKIEVLSYVSDSLNTNGFNTSVDERNSKLLVEKEY